MDPTKDPASATCSEETIPGISVTSNRTGIPQSQIHMTCNFNIPSESIINALDIIAKIFLDGVNINKNRQKVEAETQTEDQGEIIPKNSNPHPPEQTSKVQDQTYENTSTSDVIIVDNKSSPEANENSSKSTPSPETTVEQLSGSQPSSSNKSSQDVPDFSILTPDLHALSEELAPTVTGSLPDTEKVVETVDLPGPISIATGESLVNLLLEGLVIEDNAKSNPTDDNSNPEENSSNDKVDETSDSSSTPVGVLHRKKSLLQTRKDIKDIEVITIDNSSDDEDVKTDTSNEDASNAAGNNEFDGKLSKASEMIFRIRSKFFGNKTLKRSYPDPEPSNQIVTASKVENPRAKKMKPNETIVREPESEVPSTTSSNAETQRSEALLDEAHQVDSSTDCLPSTSASIAAQVITSRPSARISSITAAINSCNVPSITSNKPNKKPIGKTLRTLAILEELSGLPVSATNHKKKKKPAQTQARQPYKMELRSKPNNNQTNSNTSPKNVVSLEISSEILEDEANSEESSASSLFYPLVPPKSKTSQKPNVDENVSDPEDIEVSTTTTTEKPKAKLSCKKARNVNQPGLGAVTRARGRGRPRKPKVVCSCEQCVP